MWFDKHFPKPLDQEQIERERIQGMNIQVNNFLPNNR
jgi:hypothetical protein